MKSLSSFVPLCGLAAALVLSSCSAESAAPASDDSKSGADIGPDQSIQFNKDYGGDGPGEHEWWLQNPDVDLVAQPCDEDDDCLKYGDGNLCNGTLECADGECQVNLDTVVTCPEPDDCSQEYVCQEDSGECEPVPEEDGTECDDGEACTAGDSCLGGECVAGDEIVCEACELDADCGILDDDDECNGTYACIDAVCQVDPDTVVVCPPSDGQQCVDNVCQPANGQCATEPAGNGEPCDDENPCTEEDICQAGQCFGKPAVCDDENPCTADSCDPEAGGCQHEGQDGLDCDDLNNCTWGDICLEGQCLGQPEDCDDDDACTEDSCDPESGCINSPVVCDDGLFCNGQESCDVVAGCLAGEPPVLDDQVDCTVDVCDEELEGALHLPDVKTCDDSDLCTDESCDELAGCQYEETDCDDANPATTDICQPNIGCIHNLIPCDDANLCTQDLIDPATGDCVYLFLNCDDGDACTEDECVPATGCMYKLVNCSDMNECTDDDCNPVTGECEYDEVVCDDGNECTDDDCDIQLGCQFVDVDCDDGNDCTIDLCQPGVGCAYASKQLDGEECEDGDKCTGPDICDSGECIPGGNLCIEICNNAADDDNDWLVDCLDDDCDDDPACGPEPLCDVDGVVTCGKTINGKLKENLQGDIDDYVCSNGEFLANERIYQFIAPCSTEVTATVKGSGILWPDPDQPALNVFVLDGVESCGGDACIEAGKLKAGLPNNKVEATAVFDAVIGHKYYLVVDGAKSGVWLDTQFELIVDCVCQEEDCENGTDDDEDGAADCDDPDCEELSPCKPVPECEPDDQVECNDSLKSDLPPGQNGDIAKYSCADGKYLATEQIIEFESDCDGPVTVLLTSKGPAFPDPAGEAVNVFVLDGPSGCVGQACIAAGMAQPGTDPGEVENLAGFYAEEGRTYYLSIDAKSGVPIWLNDYKVKVECDCDK